MDGKISEWCHQHVKGHNGDAGHAVQSILVEGGGFVVELFALAGCATADESLEAAERNAREAIQIYLESLQARGSALPVERTVPL